VHHALDRPSAPKDPERRRARWPRAWGMHMSRPRSVPEATSAATIDAIPGRLVKRPARHLCSRPRGACSARSRRETMPSTAWPTSNRSGSVGSGPGLRHSRPWRAEHGDHGGAGRRGGLAVLIGLAGQRWRVRHGLATRKRSPARAAAWGEQGGARRIQLRRRGRTSRAEP